MAEETPDKEPEKKPEEAEQPDDGKKPPAKTPAKNVKGKPAAKKKKKKGGKGKLIAIVAVLTLTLIGGGATAFFLLAGKDKAHHAEVALPPPPPEPGPMTTYDFPKVLADLKTGQCRANFLSAQFMVEVGTNFTKTLQTKQPKIIEGMMLHLRSFERKDLVGKAGSDQLRADLIRIVNNLIKPEKIEGIIFKEFILQ